MIRGYGRMTTIVRMIMMMMIKMILMMVRSKAVMIDHGVVLVIVVGI